MNNYPLLSELFMLYIIIAFCAVNLAIRLRIGQQRAGLPPINYILIAGIGILGFIYLPVILSVRPLWESLFRCIVSSDSGRDRLSGLADRAEISAEKPKHVFRLLKREDNHPSRAVSIVETETYQLPLSFRSQER